MGTKYYRDTTKQDPMKEIILAPDSRTYTMNNLMDGADYMINVFPQFNGRGNGPKSSIMGKTKTLGMYGIRCWYIHPCKVYLALCSAIIP
jgi:hypothetical protein